MPGPRLPLAVGGIYRYMGRIIARSPARLELRVRVLFDMRERNQAKSGGRKQQRYVRNRYSDV